LLRAFVGRNRFIAPIGRAPPHTFRLSASGNAEQRNNAIAPYDPHFASFNFTNSLICAAASTTSLQRLNSLLSETDNPYDHPTLLAVLYDAPQSIALP
jgi:hypothetical protein